MPKWTNEQQAAIDARGCNLLVAAAAGSGKTAVLVERIIQLIINDGVDIDSLLIVTFTNAAAGEMRERIGSALLESIENKRGNGGHLRHQLNLLSKASISTLHSFCISVLRKYFHLIDLDPGFRIGDETENSLLKIEAMEELLESAYEKGEEDFLGLVERFGGSRQDIPLQELILKLHSFIQSKPYPLAWLKESVQDFKLTDEEMDNSLWFHAITRQVRVDLSGAMDLLREALVISRKPYGPIAYESVLLDDIMNLDELLGALDIGLKTCWSRMPAIKFKNLTRCGKDVDEGLKNDAKDLRDQAKKVLSDLQSSIFQGSIEGYVQDLNTLYPYMDYLHQLVAAFDKLYKEQKEERCIIDFNDLEHYTLKILEHEDVAMELKGKYRYIFIDEYQDSNIVQETIISRIIRGDNLFMVGDVKQSIYRFRLADPSLFIDKYNTYNSGEDELNRRIDLNRNFRSRPQILNAINLLFRNIMSSDFGEIPYDDNAALYPGLSVEPADSPEVEVHLVEKIAGDDGPEGEELDPDIMDLSHIEAEALIAAQRIKELIGTSIYDAKMDSYRELEYSDIVILLRSTKAWAPVYKDMLSSQGIPVYADVNNGYFEALEVKTFLNLLRLLDNKSQDIPLLSVMRSPIGGFCADDLIQIRGNSSAKTFFNAVKDYLVNMEDDLAQRLQVFYDRLNEWQQASRYLQMEAFIWKLLVDTDYFYYSGAMPGGIQRQANLSILLDRARQFQKTSIRGLFNFLRFIDKLKDSSGDMGVAKTLGENENVLRIMSIHKSKGLEFPVVIAAGMGKQFNMMDTSAQVLIHKDLGIGPKFVDPDTRQTCDTIAKAAIKNVIRLESLSEEMRILYVALTRAKDKLIILGSIRDINKAALKWSKSISSFNMSKGKCCLDWICPVLIRHNDGNILRDLVDRDDLDEQIVGNESSWKVLIHNRTTISNTLEEVTQNKQELEDRLLNFDIDIDDGLYDLVDQRFNWEYRHRAAVNIPSKLTVTEIKKLNALRSSTEHNLDKNAFMVYSSSLIDRPKFMEGSKQFTPAEKGSIMHFALQHLDLNFVQSIDSIDSQIDDLVKAEMMTKEEAQVVDLGRIKRFFDSPTGQRIMQADKVWREVPFNYRKRADKVINGLDGCMESLLIQGVIDCYFEEDGQWVLVDYKTDFILSEHTIEEIISQYRVQVELYAEALEKITGKPVKERILYLLNIDHAVTV